MALKKVLFVLLSVGTVFLAGRLTAGGNGEKLPAEPREIQQLVDQLGSEHFLTRDKAARRLLEWGEAALPALRKALRSPDPEVRRRSEQLVAEISAKVEDRALQRLLVEVNREGLDRFVAQMVKEKGFATDERWLALMTLAKAVAAKASAVGEAAFSAPALDVSKLKVVRAGPEDDCSDARVLAEGLGEVGAVERCILLSSRPLRELTLLHDSIVIVNGGIMDCTAIENCIIICRGDLGKVTSIKGSIILATGRLNKATHISRSLLQVSAVGGCTGSRDNVYVNLPEVPAVRSLGDRHIKSEQGPLQLFRFGDSRQPGDSSKKPAVDHK